MTWNTLQTMVRDADAEVSRLLDKAEVGHEPDTVDMLALASAHKRAATLRAVAIASGLRGPRGELPGDR